MKNIDSDLIRGNIDTIILTTMLDGDKYGLDIIKEVEIRSNGTYELKQPTLYSCLKRLENQELISSYWLDSDIGGRRHYYKLTEKGKESLLQKQEEWAKSKFIIDNLLSNHNYDEYRLVKKDDYEKIIEGKKFEYNESAEPSTTAQKTVIENTQDNVSFDDDSEKSDEVESFENLDNADEIEEYISVSSDNNQDNEENELPTSFKRIDYNDEDDEAENDYPNQKRFKIPSIYDSINIDETENDVVEDDEENSIYSHYSSDELESEEEIDVEESDDDETESVYSYYKEDNSEEQDYDNVDNETINYSSLSDDDEFLLGSDDDEENDDDRVYVDYYSSKIESAEEDEDSDLDNLSANSISDQSQNELNILSRLRMQDDEEINEYHGDKNSYINHLNKSEEIESLNSDNLNVVQEDLLDSKYFNYNSVDQKINEFSSAIDELNKFSSDSTEEIYEKEPEEEMIENSNAQEPAASIIDFKQSEPEDDDFLDELNSLKQNENHGFFNSLDIAEYSQTKYQPENISSFDEDYSHTDSSDAAFEKQFEDYNNQYGYNTSNEQFSHTKESSSGYNYNSEFVDNPDSETDCNCENHLSSFDDIIAKNIDTYSTERTFENEEYTHFTPQYTSNNYKQKLNNLSAYSKVNSDEPATQNITPSEETMNKVKDIQTLKTEFENEGILIKEYKKHTGNDGVDRTYLLVNKINLIKSLILFFGYVFLLSAVYIIMNNTSLNTMHNFSFKYFLYGFIPFGIYALIYLVLYIINPYKKIPAKYAPRIMIFISVIITVQLLLITYCVNLQLGFYSFTQNYYNHLLWIIPTVISFAPIVSNCIYMALYYSKNFNV